MKKIKIFPAPHIELRVLVSDKMVKDYREKQLPKKPIYEGDGYAPDGTFIFDERLCPNCGSRYEVDYDDYSYCPNCGQRIDREEE